MSYSLTFKEAAFKEWKKLAPPIQQQFKKKLAERLENPHIPGAKLSGIQDCYKIKLHTLGYRLVYRVHDDRVVVQVVAVGRRDKLEVYKKALQRVTE
jgi:mRNA interferase RelE/StbE